MAPVKNVKRKKKDKSPTVAMGKKLEALGKAMQGAEEYCTRQRATPVVIDEQTKYNGVISEQTGRVVEQVGAVVGAITGVASPQLAREDDYEVSLRFRCQR